MYPVWKTEITSSGKKSTAFMGSGLGYGLGLGVGVGIVMVIRVWNMSYFAIHRSFRTTI